MNSLTFIHHLAELLAKSVLLLALALLLMVFMRRNSAAQRHSVLLAAFLSLLLLPLGKFAAPYWRLSGSVMAPPPSHALTAVAATAVPVSVGPASAAAPARFTWPEPVRLLTGLWLAGVLLLLGFRVFGSLQIAILKRSRTTPADARIARFVKTAAHELGCERRHEVRLSAAVRVPCTWGVWRAVVLLPAEAAHWSDAHLLAALRHEFAHVSRRDYLTRWLSYLVCALYWPNPFAWLAARRLYAMQEQACDDLVLRAGTPCADYATLLFETARACTGAAPGWRNAIAMARPSTLENRVIAVVDETRDRRPAGRFAMLVSGLGVACVVGASALAQVAEVKPPAVPGGGAPVPQVQISAKFIEMPKDKYSGDQIIGDLSKLQGVDLLSAPRLVVRSGQVGSIRIGEEIGAVPGLEPKKLFAGRMLEVLPTVAHGMIRLQCTAEVVSVSGEDPATGLPIFLHQKTSSDLNVANGGKVIFNPIESKKPGHEIVVVLEAMIVPQEVAAPRADAPRDPVVPGAKPVTPAAKPGTTEATAPGAGYPPIEINAENTRLEGGVTVAEGTVQVKYGTTMIKADRVRYNPDNRRAEFQGKVEMKTDGGTMRGENMSVVFGLDGRVFIGGPPGKATGSVKSSASSGSVIDLNLTPEVVEFEGSINFDNAIQTKPDKGPGQPGSK